MVTISGAGWGGGMRILLRDYRMLSAWVKQAHAHSGRLNNKVRKTLPGYDAIIRHYVLSEMRGLVTQDSARIYISRQLRLPFFCWVINPTRHSVSKYQQYAQRIPILRCSVA